MPENGYVRTIFEPGEEQRLYAQIHEGTLEQRQAARNRLVSGYYPMVVKLARSSHFVHPSQWEDATQAGMLHLLNAAELYDPSFGYKFSTYAHTAVRNGVIQWARRETKQTSKSDAHGKRRSVVRETDLYCRPYKGSLDKQIIAKDHGNVEATEVGQSMVQVESMLRYLPDREREIIASRYGLAGHAKETLKAIGLLLGITKERVRQLQNHAHNKLSKLINL